MGMTLRASYGTMIVVVSVTTLVRQQSICQTEMPLTKPHQVITLGTGAINIRLSRVPMLRLWLKRPFFSLCMRYHSHFTSIKLKDCTLVTSLGSEGASGTEVNHNSILLVLFISVDLVEIWQKR